MGTLFHMLFQRPQVGIAKTGHGDDMYRRTLIDEVAAACSIPDVFLMIPASSLTRLSQFCAIAVAGDKKECRNG
jgi:hypothetical protein